MPQEPVAVIPGQTAGRDAEIDRPVVIGADKGQFDPFSPFVAAKGPEDQGRHMGLDGLADLDGAGRYELADSIRTALGRAVSQIDKAGSELAIIGPLIITDNPISVLQDNPSITSAAACYCRCCYCCCRHSRTGAAC